MQKELRAQATQQRDEGVAQALEHLRSAKDILENAGLKSRANSIQTILHKVSEIHQKKNPVQEMPAMRALMEAGVTQRDLMEFSKGNPVAKAKINQTLRDLGRTDKEIISFLGKHNFMDEETATSLLDPSSSLGKMWEWMQSPTAPIRPEDPYLGGEGETESMREFREGGPVSFPQPEQQIIEMSPISEPATPEPEGEAISFKSLAQAFQEAFDEADARAGKHHPKPKNPLKVKDPHTSGLTSEKMVENYKNIGIPFNLADDGNDLLDADIVDDQLEVSETNPELEMDFEDEI